MSDRWRDAKSKLLQGMMWLGLASAIIAGGTLATYSAVNTISGLAVAQSSTVWNNVKDASAGDNLTGGVLASQLYFYDGTNFDRARGDTTNGLDVDVTRMPGSSQTPSDAFANPTTFQGDWSLVGIFNGTTWDRMRSSTADALAATGLLASGTMAYNGTTWDRVRSATADALAATGLQAAGNMVYNGTTWDRWRGTTTNGALVEKKTVGTSNFNVKRANITTASVNLAFGFTSRKIMITTPTGNTDDICLDWAGGTAACPAANTAGNARIAAGTALIIDDIALTSVSVIAGSGTQTFSVTAWN